MDAAEDDVFGLGSSRRFAGELEGVASDVGEGDYLVALVVVAKDKHPVAEGGLRGERTLDQIRVTRRG